MRKKPTEIMIETTRVFFAKLRGTQNRLTCRRCGEEIQMVTVTQAATVTGISSAAVHELIEADQIPFKGTAEGLAPVSVCLNCLIKAILTR